MFGKIGCVKRVGSRVAPPVLGATGLVFTLSVLTLLVLTPANAQSGSLPQLPATEQPVRTELLDLVREIQGQLDELAQNDPQNSEQITALRSELEILVLQAEIEKLQRENVNLVEQLEGSASGGGALPAQQPQAQQSSAQQSSAQQSSAQPASAAATERRIEQLGERQSNLNAQLGVMAEQHAELLQAATSPGAEGEAQRHTVRPGDSLSELAQTYYDDATRWPDILAANPEISDPDILFVGTQLVIP